MGCLNCVDYQEHQKGVHQNQVEICTQEVVSGEILQVDKDFLAVSAIFHIRGNLELAIGQSAKLYL